MQSRTFLNSHSTLYLLKSWGQCCYKSLFLLFPSPHISCVDLVETKLQSITPTLHWEGGGRGKMRHFDKLLCFCPKSFDQGCSNTLCNTGVGGADKGVKSPTFFSLHFILSLRASSPIWASEASLARTRPLTQLIYMIN